MSNILRNRNRGEKDYYRCIGQSTTKSNFWRNRSRREKDYNRSIDQSTTKSNIWRNRRGERMIKIDLYWSVYN